MGRPLTLERNRRRIDAAAAVVAQTDEAQDALCLERDAWLRLPWPSLDDVVGGIGLGNVWFVGGFSGNGKTTFLMNLTAELLLEDKVIYYLGTETRANELRTRLACQRVGCYAGDVLSGASRQWDNWSLKRAALRDDIQLQRTLGANNRFLVCPVQRVTATELVGSFEDANIQGADLVIIDHIDHMEHGAGKTGFEDSRMLAHLVLDLGQSTGIPVIAATQFNNEGARGDRLGQYQPPQPHHVYMGGHKRQIAWGMLGLYRPLKDGLTKDQLKDARAGKLEPAQFLEPNCMAISVMKHRYYGSREGQRVRLEFDHGRLKDIPERDQYVTDMQTRGPRP